MSVLEEAGQMKGKSSWTMDRIESERPPHRVEREHRARPSIRPLDLRQRAPASLAAPTNLLWPTWPGLLLFYPASSKPSRGSQMHRNGLHWAAGPAPFDTTRWPGRSGSADIQKEP